jgi:hypothetical protein
MPRYHVTIAKDGKSWSYQVDPRLARSIARTLKNAGHQAVPDPFTAGKDVEAELGCQEYKYRCNKCHRPMKGTTAYDGACKCGGFIEADPSNYEPIKEEE